MLKYYQSSELYHNNTPSVLVILEVVSACIVLVAFDNSSRHFTNLITIQVQN